jgi:hypothetical protein
VIPADWAEAAGSFQVQNEADDEHGQAGYGYCFWRNIDKTSFRADGVFSQLGYCFPEHDACVVMTAGEIRSTLALDCCYRYFPAIFQDSPGDLPPIPKSELRLPPLPELYAAPHSKALEKKIDGRVVQFTSVPQFPVETIGFPVSVMPLAVFFMSTDKAGHIDFIRFRFQQNTLKFSWSEGDERNTVLCGMDGLARKCKITLGGIDFTVTCSAAWEGRTKLHVWIRPLESVAQRRMTFHFRGDTVRMLPHSSPDLSTIGDYARRYALSMIPNAALSRLIAANMTRIAVVAEPIHIGMLR